MSISGLLSTRKLFWKTDCPTNQIRSGTVTNQVSIFKAKLATFWDGLRQKLNHTGLYTGTKEHITVLPCFNAAGQFIPPFILFSGKRAPVGYNPLEGAAPGKCLRCNRERIYGCTHVLPLARQSFHSPFASYKASCPFSRPCGGPH